MLTTVDYIVKHESGKMEAEQSKISEKTFENYLYGIRM
jgi:hypothetical protein